MLYTGNKLMRRWLKLCLALSAIFFASVISALSWADETVEQDKTQFQWIEDAIEIAKFVEDNQLIIREDSYDKYEAHIATLTHDEKLPLLYELLVDAMFTSREDLTTKFMPLYIESIEAVDSREHRQSLSVLETATEYYLKWDYAGGIDALDLLARDKSYHPFARIRALSIMGYYHGYRNELDALISITREVESIAASEPENIFIEKERSGLKGFTAHLTNDQEEIVKYTGDSLKLSQRTGSLTFGDIVAGNLTHLVMQQGHIEGIDRIDAIAQRIAIMTENPASIVRAFTACGVSAVRLNRQARAVECFAEADKYNRNERSQYNVRHYLFAAIAYARDEQAEIARSYLNRLNAIENVEDSIHYKTHIDWARSEVLHAEGHYADAYALQRDYYAKRDRKNGQELGKVSRSLRLYAEEQIEIRNKKADLIAANSELKDQIIHRHRILFYAGLVIFGLMILAGLYQFRMSRKLRLARQQADKANAAKSEFLANMSHEIRTPMNGVLGMIQVLRQSRLNEDQQSWADIIYKSGRNLMDVLNDILDFSKIEAGQLEIYNQPMNIKNLIEEVVTLLSPLAEEKYISLNSNYQGETSFDVVGDDSRLRQVLTNLIANAIKFTLEGSVQVTLDVTSQGNQNQLKISVKDTGIGIEADKLALIFEGFQQAENSTTRRFGGSGLGLTICQQLVEAMGGKIRVESKLGQGSNFVIDLTLPRHVKELSPSEALIDDAIDRVGDMEIENSIIPNSIRSDRHTPPLRMLVDTTLQNSLEFADQIAGHNKIKTHTYSDLKSMIQALKRAASQNAPFDYLFLNHPIQGKSGLSVAKAISENQHFGDVGIVIISSKDLSKYKPVLKKIDIVDFVQMPATSSELEDLMERLVQTHETTHTDINATNPIDDILNDLDYAPVQLVENDQFPDAMAPKMPTDLRASL